jgi:hypothetical protein
VKAQTSSLAAGSGDCSVLIGTLVTGKTVDVHVCHGSSIPNGERDQMRMEKKDGKREGWPAQSAW